MPFEFAAYSHQGQRANNEDACRAALDQGTLLAVVADGLGGHANGEVASQLAVDTIFRSLTGVQPEEDALCYALLDASEAIRQAPITGLTTAAALWAGENLAIAAHVGDSRIYQFRKDAIVFQSVDHSVVQLAVLVGELEPEAIRTHKDRNKVFRVLGDPGDPPRVDCTELTVQPGDRFLLCSDGFWEPVLEADMLRTMARTTNARQWLEAMKDMVLAARDPKQDNHTAICVLVK